MNEGREGVIRPDVWAAGAFGIGEARRMGVDMERIVWVTMCGWWEGISNNANVVH